MLPSSTIIILKSLSLQELKRFGEFVKTPYFNSISSLEIIYNSVLKAYPDFTSAGLSDAKMAKKIFPKGENKEKRIKNLYSEFGNLLRKFLGFEEMLNHKQFELDVLIAESMSRKSLLEESQKFIKKSITQNDNGLLTDSLKFNYLERMNTQRMNNFSQLGIFDAELVEVMHARSELSIVSFLRDLYTNANAITLTDRVFGIERKKEMNEAISEAINIDKFLNYLKETNNKYYSYLKINYLLYYYSENDINEEQLFDLQNEIFKTIHNIEKWEAYTIIARTIEIILGKLVVMDKKYDRDVFELSKLFCELKVFPDHSQDFLHIGIFRDMFTPALNLKEYDWAESFVNEYSKYLSEGDRENEFNYCSGILNFKRGKYKESLDFFSKVKLEAIQLKINVRFYYLMNYIELKAYESARSVLHAFRQFYKENAEMSEHHASLIPDALKYFGEIIRCEETGAKLDELVYMEAHDGRRFNHAIYIRGKMEQLK